MGICFGDGRNFDIDTDGNIWVVSNVASDLDEDGSVGIVDLLMLLAAWGPCPAPPEPCPADLTSDESMDGFVSIGDFLILLAGWGCPQGMTPPG